MSLIAFGPPGLLIVDPVVPPFPCRLRTRLSARRMSTSLLNEQKSAELIEHFRESRPLFAIKVLLSDSTSFRLFMCQSAKRGLQRTQLKFAFAVEFPLVPAIECPVADGTIRPDLPVMEQGMAVARYDVTRENDRFGIQIQECAGENLHACVLSQPLSAVRRSPKLLSSLSWKASGATR